MLGQSRQSAGSHTQSHTHTVPIATLLSFFMALRPWQTANNKNGGQAYCKAAKIRNRIEIRNRIRIAAGFELRLLQF